jgi:hypothetical protein
VVAAGLALASTGALRRRHLLAGIDAVNVDFCGA